MTVRWTRTALALTLIFSAGCVRHRTLPDFGLNTRPAKPTPDASLRATFREQTKGAFNPLSDDSRIRTLEARLTDDPANIDARLELAAVYESYRMYDQALEHYTQTFDRISSEKAILGIARCDQALNLAWRAIPLLEQYLKKTPSPVVWNVLGLLQNASGDLPAGELAFRQAVVAAPQSDQWHNNLGYNLLLQNQTDAAEAEFRKALELNPKSVTTHNNLGMLLARRNNFDGAFNEFQFGADAATAHNNLAVVLMELGKYEQSRDQLVKALAVRRNFSPALSNFKLVQERMRQRAELQKLEKLPKSDVRVAATVEEENKSK